MVSGHSSAQLAFQTPSSHFLHKHAETVDFKVGLWKSDSECLQTQVQEKLGPTTFAARNLNLSALASEAESVPDTTKTI